MKFISSYLFVIFTFAILHLHAQTPGDVDLTFECGFYSDNVINLIGKQSDGKYILAGELNTFNNTWVNQIVRLNPDRTVDPTFNPGSGLPPCNLTDMLILPDDKIILTGDFLSYDGHPAGLIVRLNADGSFDDEFNTAGLGLFYPPDNLTLQSDGKIIFSGGYLQIPAYKDDMIVRMNSEGTRDSSFHINLGVQVASDINDMALQSDGKLIIGGEFLKLITGENEKNLMRLNTNGSIDNTFQTTIGTAAGGVSGNNISQIAVEADNSILLIGKFSTFNGTAVPGFTRLLSGGTIDPTFSAGTGFSLAFGTPGYTLMEETPAGHIYVGGSFSSYNGNTLYNLVEINHDGSYQQGFTTATLSDMVIEDDLSFSVVGSFGEFSGFVRNNFVHVFADGTVDDLDLPVGGISAGIHDVRDMIITEDQKIIIGGDFRYYNNMPFTCIVKLNTDGSPDTSFNVILETTEAWFSIQDIEQTPDGKIYIAGDFTKVNGIGRKRIARLNADGSLDLTFNPGSGANNEIYKIGVQPDGKIIIAGLFGTVNGISRKKLARLNSDGSVDLSFDPGDGPNSDQMYCISFQTDNKILIGGMFTKYNGISRKYIARLNSNGTLDSGFNPGSGPGYGPTEFFALPDGKLLVAGTFNVFNGSPANNVVRLNSDGTIDPTAPFGTGFTGGVSDIDVMDDGSYLISGGFNSYNGVAINDVAVINADGSLNMDFDPGYGGTNPYPWYNTVEEIEKLDDGNFMLMGDFSSFNGVTRDCVARIYGVQEVCSIPTGLFANNITTSKAKLNWDIVAGVENYQIYYRAVGAASWIKKKTSVNFKTIVGLEPNTMYEYKIRTDCGEGYTDFSSVETFTTLPLRENLYSESISIFPNPSTGKFTILFPELNNGFKIEIYDITGSLLFENMQLQNNQIQITVENYTGILMVRISDGGQTITKQIIIQ